MDHLIAPVLESLFRIPSLKDLLETLRLEQKGTNLCLDPRKAEFQAPNRIS